MPRVTIKEIARRCGVSQGAVSYALNNQPGVSEATRARVLKVAAELEWVPNWAARQLSAARSETFGLVLARTVQTLIEEPYFMGFVGGVESVLGEKSYALALQVVADLDEEQATYRKWAAERRVDGVIVVDLRVADPRIPLLRWPVWPSSKGWVADAGRRHTCRLGRLDPVPDHTSDPDRDEPQHRRLRRRGDAAHVRSPRWCQAGGTPLLHAGSAGSRELRPAAAVIKTRQ